MSDGDDLNAFWDAPDQAAENMALWRQAVQAAIEQHTGHSLSVDPQWLTSTVAALAQGIYADRAFDRLPILADALQDAGCGNEDVLAHCRGAGPHARGCWVVDLLLGKT
jgi:hypothetical protein